MEDHEICSLCDSWIDQDLSDSMRMVFDSHLNQCDECRLKIQRWQDFEHELVTAFSLFGSPDVMGDQAKEVPFDVLQTTKAVPSTLGDLKWQASVDEVRKSRWLFRDYRMWTVAATLMFAVVLSWIAFGKKSHLIQHASFHPNENQPALANDQTKSRTRSTETKPVVHVKVQEPVIASTPVTTPRFTVVSVYPVFSVDPSDQAN